MIRYGVTIFLSAFLLFQVQPVIARFILPWFGGTAAVWTTCLMFFQTLLLLGYLYAHALRKLCRPKMAWLIHAAVLCAAAFFASVIPADTLQPTGIENLTTGIIKVLLVSVGLPFFALSTTGPLVQAWQSCSHQDQSPYRLYALSNVGSMLALVSYPFLVERILPLADQAFYWQIGFWVFAAICLASGWQACGFRDWQSSEPSVENPQKAKDAQNTGDVRNTGDAQNSGDSENVGGVGIGKMLIWTVLSMAASIVLLATTNLMCQEVASVPFLWILPLSLYLLSFIICFDRPALYRRRVFTPLLVVGAILSIAIVHLNVYAGFGLQIIGLSTVCFAASMTCHGELERMKPDSRHLTAFYLWVSVGGALGGIFVCVISPHLFLSFCEFQIGIMICLLVSLWTLYKYSKEIERPSLIVLGSVGLSISFALAMYATSLMYFLDSSFQQNVVYRGRNEYGLSSVEDVPEKRYRRFVNGRIEHGGQSLVAGSEMEHISYYVPGSGVGVAFEAIRSQSDRPLKVGVLGLGAGAMTTWVKPADSIVFFEINPIVAEIAEKYFTYLSKCPADCSVVLGDGRIQLQKLLKQQGPAGYDLLFMDAFASDSIPIHLLTRECVDLYFEHLKSDGVLIAHITNRFIDLRPVLLNHAKRLSLEPVLIEYQSPDEKFETRWVILTRNEGVLNSDAVKNFQSPTPEDLESVKWTDDYASVAALLDWSAAVDWKKMKANVNKNSPEN